MPLSDLGSRFRPEAARALATRHRLPRSRSNDGKTLVSVDLAEVNTSLPGRSSGGHQAGALKARVEGLLGELTKLEAIAGGHRADYERERDRADALMAELLRMTADLMTAKETAARLEGELAALKARPRWRRLVG